VTIRSICIVYDSTNQTHSSITCSLVVVVVVGGGGAGDNSAQKHLGWINLDAPDWEPTLIANRPIRCADTYRGASAHGHVQGVMQSPAGGIPQQFRASGVPIQYVEAVNPNEGRG
jgi:hypothetical protein